MAIRFNIGGENFEKLRRCGGYYVDKTELLYELVEEKFNDVTLFTSRAVQKTVGAAAGGRAGPEV